MVGKKIEEEEEPEANENQFGHYQAQFRRPNLPTSQSLISFGTILNSISSNSLNQMSSFSSGRPIIKSKYF
jgi:hypothetical protein